MSMLDDVKYIGDDKFVVTKEWLQKTLEKAIEARLADSLGVDNWQGWDFYEEGMADLFPEYEEEGYDAEGVAERLITDMVDEHDKTQTNQTKETQNAQ